MPAKPSLSPCWGCVAKERDTSHLHWPSSSNGKMTYAHVTTAAQKEAARTMEKVLTAAI